MDHSVAEVLQRTLELVAQLRTPENKDFTDAEDEAEADESEDLLKVQLEEQIFNVEKCHEKYVEEVHVWQRELQANWNR